MESKKSEKTLAIDYIHEGFVFEGQHAGNDFRSLYDILLTKCSFMLASDHMPAYRLYVTNEGKAALGEACVNLLEAVVNYHNHIVEKGNQNQGGQL